MLIRSVIVAVIVAVVVVGFGPASAGVRYMDKAPMIAIVKHRIEAERVQARRERIARQQAREQAAAEAAANAVATTAETPTTESAPAVSYSGPMNITPDEATAAMRAAGFPESVIPYFLSTIIPRESGFCPTAVYPGHCGDVSLMIPGGPACSLFQLYTCPGPQAADPYVAARYAYSKYRSSGLSPWGG